MGPSTSKPPNEAKSKFFILLYWLEGDFFKDLSGWLQEMMDEVDTSMLEEGWSKVSGKGMKSGKDLTIENVMD